MQVREGRLAASDTAQLFRESTPHLRRALKKVYAHDGSEKLSAAAAIAPATLRLPTCAKYLLLAAHLASRFPARMDVALFSSIRRGAKQRRTKRTQAHDEPRPFTLERLLTTYAHIQPETELAPLRVEVHVARPARHPHFAPTTTTTTTQLYSLSHTITRARAAQQPLPITHPYVLLQVLVQLGTLIQQQLVVRVSSEAVLEGMRLRCETPQDTLKTAAEELKFDLDRYFEDVAGA